MARTAKCRICGRVLDTSVAYKIAGKPNKYFCSYEEWQAEEERKKKATEDKDRVYRLICDIMGEEEIISTALYKEWVIWNKVADNAKIACYLEENKETLTIMISRLENKIYNRIRYLSTVLKNGLGDYKPKTKEEVRVEPRVVTVDETMYDATPTTTRKRRRSLDDLEDDV